MPGMRVSLAVQDNPCHPNVSVALSEPDIRDVIAENDLPLVDGIHHEPPVGSGADHPQFTHYLRHRQAHFRP